MTALFHRPDLQPVVRLDATQTRHRAAVLAAIRDGRYELQEVRTCLSGSSDREVVLEGDRFGLPVAMVICHSCGLLRSSPRLTSDSLPAFYEDDYHGLHQGARPPGAALYQEGQGELIYRRVLAHLLPKPELSVFEIGCGSGTVLREFAAAAERDALKARLAGCEYSAVHAAEGQRQGVDVRRGGIETLAGSGTPDLIILSHVVEHFSDMPAELEAISALCSEETLLYVEVPGVMSIHRNDTYEFRLAQYFTLAHTYHFTSASLTATLGRAGFHCLQTDEYASAIFRKGEPLLETENVYPVTMDYLRRLDSMPVRARRYALLGTRLARRSSSRLLRIAAGEGAVNTARGIGSRLRSTLRGDRL